MKHKLTLLISLLFLIACSGNTANSEPPTQITVQLSWFHTVEFAGFYTAIEQGFYADENLEVTILPGGPDVSPNQAVIDGEADFGIVGSDAILLSRADGESLTAVMTILRRSPVVLMALAESGIEAPADFAGKRVQRIAPNMDSSYDIQLLAMLTQASVDIESINFMEVTDYSLGALLSDEVDVYNAFSTNEVVDANLRGVDVNLIFPEEYGIQIYSDLVFANQSFIDENPEVVARFVQATLKGYQYAIEHIDEAVATTLTYDETLDEDFQRASMRAEIPLIDTGDSRIGLMDTAVWESTHSILLEQGLLAEPIDWQAAFTNEFNPEQQ
ncbi:MAG: ABC transporter substrate-binding protein [Ardenticatenaceae bacterium]|nr:ABC transporter substrate-binding protein [Ardenticatenaceae bacterium]